MHRLRGQQRQQHVSRPTSQVSCMERPTQGTMRMESPTEDTTDDAAPQPNVSNTADEVDEGQAPPEPTSEPSTDTSIPQEVDSQLPAPVSKKSKMIWPHGSGLPGFGRYRGTKWHDFEPEEQDKHDDPPLPAITSSDSKLPGDTNDDKQQPRRSPRVSKRKRRTPNTEQSSDSNLPEHTKDDKSSGDDRTRNSGYPKFSIDEYEDHDDDTKTYIRYRIRHWQRGTLHPIPRDRVRRDRGLEPGLQQHCTMRLVNAQLRIHQVVRG